MVYILRFLLFKMRFVSCSNVFGSCIIHILFTGCAQIKKKNSGAKRLNRLCTCFLRGCNYKNKVNQSHYRPEVLRGFQEVKVPRLRDYRMVVRLSALRSGRF